MVLSDLDEPSLPVLLGWFHLQPGLQALLQNRPNRRPAAASLCHLDWTQRNRTEDSIRTRFRMGHFHEEDQNCA